MSKEHFLLSKMDPTIFSFSYGHGGRKEKGWETVNHEREFGNQTLRDMKKLLRRACPPCKEYKRFIFLLLRRVCKSLL